MPIYIFEHPKTGEIKEVIQGMNDVHELEIKGVKWRRIFTSPTAAIDTQWNAHSERDFIEKSSKKKGTVGDLWEKSKELGAKRGDNGYERWSKMRGGKKKHPEVLKKEATDFAAKKGFNLEL